MAKSDASETSRLLAAPVVDPEAAASPVTSNGSHNGEADGVKELGDRIYVLLPAVAIGVRSSFQPIYLYLRDATLMTPISSCCSLP